MRKLTKFEFFCLRLLWKLPLWNLHLILKCSLVPSLSLHLGSGLNISQLNGGSHWVHAVFLLLCYSACATRFLVIGGPCTAIITKELHRGSPLLSTTQVHVCILSDRRVQPAPTAQTAHLCYL